MNVYISLLASIALGVIGQILLKKGMSRHPGIRLREFPGLIRDWAILAGIGAYGGSTLLYFQALAGIGLSIAYPTVSLGYVLVVVISRLLFKEPVSMARRVAVGMICAGVALVGIGAG